VDIFFLIETHEKNTELLVQCLQREREQQRSASLEAQKLTALVDTANEKISIAAPQAEPVAEDDMF
jgi:hypothetical protein